MIGIQREATMRKSNHMEIFKRVRQTPKKDLGEII